MKKICIKVFRQATVHSWNAWVRVVLWWRMQDHRHRYRWRVLNGAVAVLMLAAVILPVAQNLVQSNAYALSADTIGLVGHTDPRLTKQLTYDAKDSQYQFNKDGISKSDMPAALQHATVGTPTDKNSSTYALDVPTDLSKGVTYHDTNSHLSFSLVPQFKAMQGKDVAGHLVYPLSGGTQAIYTLKGNGLKEDIVVQKAASDTMTFSYKLNLPDTLEAKAIPNSGGAIGIYSADPALFGDITFGSSADQRKVEKARVNGAKTYLVFGLPAPVIKVADGGSVGDAWARFELKGDTLSVVASGLSKLKAPVTIDPSVLVSSATDFSSQGNNEGMIALGSSGGGVPGSVGAWQSGGNIASARQGNAVVVYNGYLYSLGGDYFDGTTDTAYNDVQFAPIDAAGNVGTWQYTYNSAATSSFVGGFTNERSGLHAATYNGYLYVFGGSTYNDVQYAPINANGTVGTWQYTYNSAATSSFVGGFTNGRQAFAGVAYNGYLYVFGGNGSSSPTYNDVQYAPINANGTVGTWQYTYNSAATSSFVGGFTTARDKLGGAVYNGYLYVLGGQSLTSDPRGGFVSTELNDVQYAPINANGTVGTWQYTYNSAATSSFVGGFTTARDSFGTGIYNGYIYVLGGVDGQNELNDVQYAPINANGTVGTWQATTSLTTAEDDFGFTIDGNGHMYIVAGINAGSNAIASVQHASISTGTVAVDGTALRSNITGGSIGSWTTSSNNNATAADNRGAVVYNGYLYSVGGTDGTGQSVYDVQYALINADGSIGVWQNTTSLPSAIVANHALAYNGYLYALGNYNNGTATVTTALYAKINSDGSIEGTWHASSSSLPDLMSIDQPQVYNGYMYIIGGWDNTLGADTNTTYYAPVNADGSVGTWTLGATTFSSVRESTGTAVYNGYLYVMGGLNYIGGVFTYFNDVQYAKINADGSVGTWATTSSFTTGRDDMTAEVYGGYMYIFSGAVGGGLVVGDVQYAPVYANGKLGSWQTGPSLTSLRSFGAAAYNNHLYLVGGYSTASSSALATTMFASISASAGAPPTGSVDFGNTTAGTLNDTGQKSHITCSEYAAPYSGTVSSISLNVNSIAGTNTAKKYEVAVYESDGSGGAPGTKVASSAAGTLVVGWNTLSVSAAVSGGTNYWLCWNNNSGSTSTNNVTYGSGSNPSAQSSSTITYTTWSDSPAMITGTTQYAVYATMTASPSTLGTIGGWGPGTSLTTARQVGASVVYNGYIYTMGGNNGTSALSDVQYAQIKSDGTLGSWGTAGDFGTARQYFSAVASNGYLYILGGLLSGGAGNLNTVQYAQIKSDGTLGSFNSAANFTTARASLAAAAYNGYVYLFGGTDGATNVYQDVWYGQIGSDGNISSWVQATSMNTKRTGAEAVVYDGYLYALSGTNGTTDQNTVEYAQIKSDGSLGTWTTSGSTLGTARDHFGAVAANGYMYVFGGYNGALTAAAEYAPINADGSLGSWNSTTAMTSARQAFGFAAYNGYVYSIGGNVSNAASTSVIYAPLNSIALIGHYSKLLDLGSTVTVTGITYTGTLGNGINDISYRAANSAGAFTYTGTASDLTSSCTGGLANVRYILVMITFDDSMDGTGPDSSGAHANVSSFTVNYKTGHPVPAQRLRGGKTLQGGVLSPLDIGAGGGGCSA